MKNLLFELKGFITGFIFGALSLIVVEIIYFCIFYPEDVDAFAKKNNVINYKKFKKQ